MSARRLSSGHILMEAMVSGAILLWALAGVVAALLAGARLLGTATMDRAATDAVTAQVERLRALPSSNAAWAAGITNGPVAGHPGWVLQTTVTDVVDVNTGLPVPLGYKRAEVTVTYGPKFYTEEVYR